MKNKNVELAEVIDIQVIQSLMSDFNKLTHIPIGLNDLKGNVLAVAGWQDICTQFHRKCSETYKHCIESDTKLTADILPGETRLYRCKNNMWDIATPIIVGSQQVGFIFSGQFFFDDEPLDYELFRAQARKHGFNEAEYIAALEKVPRLSRKAVRTGMAFFMKFANLLSKLSYSNSKLTHSLSECDALVAALRESEKREKARSDELAGVLDAAPAVVLITHDPQALKITGNRLSCEWLQLPENANLSKAAPAGEKPEGYKLFKDGVEIPLADMPMRTAASGKEVRDYEFDLVYNDGTVRHLFGDARPLFDEQGNPRGAVAAFIDISKRQQAEKALQNSETRFRALAENSPDLITRFDRQYCYLYANPAATESYNIPLDEIVGKTHGELGGTPKKVKFWEEHLENVFVTGKTETLEYYYISPQGKRYYFNTKIVPEFTDGKITSVLAVSRDITDIREAESKLKETLDNLENLVEARTAELETAFYELKESESRFRNLFEVIASGVAIFDAIDHGHDFILKDINPAYERIFHTSRENIIRKGLSEIFPEANKLGFNEVLRWVWMSGLHEFLPLTLHVDSDTTLWLTSNIFRLPSGELVTVFEDITERKKASEEREQLLGYIQQEKDRLSALVNSITDEVWFADTRKIFTLMNPSAFNKFNICHREEFSADKLVEYLKFYYPDGSQLPLEQIPPLRALNGEIIKNQEEIVSSIISGELRYRHVSASPVYDASGSIIGSVSIVRDITENKKAEAALQKSEEQYRALFNTMNEGFCIIEVLFDENEKPIDYVFLETNPAFEKQTGLSNVVGKRVRELIPTNEEYWFEIYGKVALTGESARFENLVEGLYRWYEVYAYRIGQPVSRRVAIIFNDITERKKSDEALRESEEKYRIIVETANEGIVKTDNESVINYVNKKMLDMLGYSLEEAINKPIWGFISDKYKPIIKLNLENKKQGLSESGDLELICKDGTHLWVHMNSKPIFDKQGKYMGAVSMLTDITKRKEAEESLANIELARKKEIHHRIKNNLQVISSLLDLQAEKFKDRENIRDSEVIDAFRESQSRVISMALIHEELYRGSGFETLNFSAYIEELADNLLSSYRLGNKDISLNRDLEEDFFLNMDVAIPLGIIVNELISNSFKHAFSGRDSGEIRIKFHKEEIRDFINLNKESKFEGRKSTKLILSISDNGVGIPENLDIENLDSLGLHLVASLVEQLDGELEIKRNNGTEFIIRLSVTEKNDKASMPAPLSCRESPEFS